MRLACTDRSAFLAALGSGFAPNSVPQTRQRVAFSLNLVPQVGQTFVLVDEGSGLIRGRIIPSKEKALFLRSLDDYHVIFGISHFEIDDHMGRHDFLQI
jgi:hypothetical protein